MAAASVPEPMGVHLCELPFLGQVNLRGDPQDQLFLAATRDVLKFHLPTAPNTVSSASGSGVSALWLGPDEWLLVGAPGSEEDVVARLRDALAGLHSSVLDVTASRTTIELAGGRSRHVLMKGCSFDLHPRVFLPRQCAQTNFARTIVIIEQLDAAPTWRLYVRSSFTVYLAKWLIDAMKEYAADHESHPAIPLSPVARSAGGGQ